MNRALAISVILGLIILLFSCQKENINISGPQNSYYIRFKANGVQKEYTLIHNSAMINSHDGEDTVFYSAFSSFKEDNDYQYNSLGIILQTQSPMIEHITYTNYTSNNNSDIKAKLLSIVYIDETGLSSGNQGDMLGYSADTKLYIDEITNDYVKASFSASVYQAGISDTPKYIISEGNFFLKRIE